MIDELLTDAMHGDVTDVEPSSGMLERAQRRAGVRKRRRLLAAGGAFVVLVLASLMVWSSPGHRRVQTIGPGPSAPVVSQTTSTPSTVPGTSSPSVAPTTADRPQVLVGLTVDYRLVRLDPNTGAVTKVLYDPHLVDNASESQPPFGSLALSADRSTVYFDSGENAAGGFVQPDGVIRRVSVDGSGPAEKVADGFSPALSPDGTKLAYVAKANADQYAPDTVIVRDLASGVERTVMAPLYPASANYVSVINVSWAPDSRHLVAEVGGEGYRASNIVLSDTDASTQLVEPGGSTYLGDPTTSSWWSPTFLPDGTLLIATRTYPSDSQNPDTERIVVIDPQTTRIQRVVAEAPFGTLGATAADNSGTHLLYITHPGVAQTGTWQLMVADNGNPPTALATGIAQAAW